MLCAVGIVLRNRAERIGTFEIVLGRSIEIILKQIKKNNDVNKNSRIVYFGDIVRNSEYAIVQITIHKVVIKYKRRQR